MTPQIPSPIRPERVAMTIPSGRVLVDTLGAGAVVFALGFAAGVALQDESTKAIQTAGAVAVVLSGFLLSPLRRGVVGNRDIIGAVWLIVVCVAAGVAGGVAVTTSASTTMPGVLRLTVAVGVMLFFLEGLAAFITGLLRDRSSAAFVALALICLAALAPLWMGPWVEKLAEPDWFANIVVAASPLTYVAVMAEYDYLHDQWFYTHAPLGAYRFGYPGQLVSSSIYVAFGITFRIMAAFAWSGNTTAARFSRTDPRTLLKEA